MSATLQAILDSLQTGSYKAQWNACYALSSLLTHQGLGGDMVECRQTPLILDQLTHILTSNPNFKVLKPLDRGHCSHGDLIRLFNIMAAANV